MQEMEWLPIDEVEVENVADIPLIRNATGTPVGQGTCLWRLNIILLLFLVREKLSVYVHNCVIDDFLILKFLMLMKWVFYELYHTFQIFVIGKEFEIKTYLLPL